MKRFLIVLMLAASAVVIGPALAYTQTVRADPELRLFLAEAPPECRHFGKTDGGTDMWLGDCVAAPADTDTPVPMATDTPAPTNTNTPVSSNTPAAPTNTPRTRTATPAMTNTAIVTVTVTAGPPTATAQPMPSPTPGGGNVAPYPSAPLCADHGELHDNDKFHTIWDANRGCHYDHEHGTNPFVPAVAQTFVQFDLRALLGGVEVGHSNPSSPLENTDKHGGFKWDVTLNPVTKGPACTGREGAATGVDKIVTQYHGFGNYAIEFEARVHSALALMRQCRVGNPTDYGYVFVIQHQDYGQRTAPYQGFILPYPDTPLPAYDPAREPYLTISCFGNGFVDCARNPSRQSMVNSNANTDTTWSGEPVNINGSGSELFNLIFRARDTYQVLNSADLTYPFTMLFMCSTDGGATYNAAMPGCRWNNSTTRVHSVGGEIPAAWANSGMFTVETDANGNKRLTGEAFVSAFGDLQGFCHPAEPACFPIKLVSAFTGDYGVGFDLSSEPINFNPLNLPERDIYFCGNAVCAEGAPGAKASGWIGPGN